MSDYLVRGMSMDGFVKAVAIRSTEIVSRAAQIHGTTPNATAALGRALSAASMMGNMQKVENGSMTLQIRGGGPIGTITVVSDPVGNVRGCVTEPKVPLVEKYPGKSMWAYGGRERNADVIRSAMKGAIYRLHALVSAKSAMNHRLFCTEWQFLRPAPWCSGAGLFVRVAGGYLIQCFRNAGRGD